MTVYYSIHTGHPVDPDGYPEEFLTDVKPPAPGYRYTGERWVASDPIIEAKLEAERKRVFEEINARVMELYHIYTPLQMEYLEREKQAREWAASGFVGDAPPQVTAYSEPARVNPVEACSLIIRQADDFRQALDYVSILRMRKHGVDNSTTIAELREYEKNTMAQIDYVVNTLP